MAPPLPKPRVVGVVDPVKWKLQTPGNHELCSMSTVDTCTQKVPVLFWKSTQQACKNDYVSMYGSVAFLFSPVKANQTKPGPRQSENVRLQKQVLFYFRESYVDKSNKQNGKSNMCLTSGSFMFVLFRAQTKIKLPKK